MEKPGKVEEIFLLSSDEEDFNEGGDVSIEDGKEVVGISKQDEDREVYTVSDSEDEMEVCMMNIRITNTVSLNPEKSWKRKIESESDDDLHCIDSSDVDDDDSDIDSTLDDSDDDEVLIQRQIPKDSGSYDQLTRFTLIHDLAVYATLDQAVGPSIKCCDQLENPFSNSIDERPVRVMMENRRKGKHREDSDQDLIEQIYKRGNFREQLAPCDRVDSAETECKKLMHDFFPLATGEGDIEAFRLPHHFYPDIWLNSGFDLGLRHSKNARSDLQPGKMSSIYGDVWKLQSSDYQFFSTFIKRERLHESELLPLGTYAMMGPIQLVNHSSKEPNAEFLEDGYRIVLNIIKPVKPGEELLVNYGEDFQKFLLNSQNWPANVLIP